MPNLLTIYHPLTKLEGYIDYTSETINNNLIYKFKYKITNIEFILSISIDLNTTSISHKQGLDNIKHLYKEHLKIATDILEKMTRHKKLYQ